MPISSPQKKCAIFTVWTIRNKPQIISNSATRTKKLGASMRTKTFSSVLDSGGQTMTEMQHRWKLTGASLAANLTWVHFLSFKYFFNAQDCIQCHITSHTQLFIWSMFHLYVKYTLHVPNSVDFYLCKLCLKLELYQWQIWCKTPLAKAKIFLYG